MTDKNEVFSKMHSENKNRVFRIKTQWEDGYFRLFVFHETNSWFALVTKENIRVLAEQHEIAPDEYLKNLREFICNNQPSISCDIVKKQFIVYRSIEKLRIKYFFVNLEKLNYEETIESLLDDLVEKHTTLIEKINVLESQKLDFESQKFQYEQKCTEFVELKRKADLQMYSTFALALNEKKHRIRYLTELLEEYQAEGTQKFGSVKTTRKKTKALKERTPSTSTSKPKESISESESNPSDGYNTDDEKQVAPFEENVAVASTSKDNLDFLGGDSPPPVSLPKRIKCDDNSLSIPIHTAVKCSKQNVQSNGPKVDAMDVQEEEADTDDESLQLSTQELLERM